MTLVEMRALFRLMAGPEFDEVANEAVDAWHNEAHRYICAAFRVYQCTAEVQFHAGVAAEPVPANFVAFDDEYGTRGALINGNTLQGLIEITPAEARLKTTTGHEAHVWFWIWARHIYAFPFLQDSPVHRLLYFGMDADLTTDGVHPSPSYAEAYHELLVTYALYKAYLSKVQEGTRDKRALTHWNLFKEQVSIVKAKEKGRGPSD